MEQEIDQIERHHLVSGFGRVSPQVVDNLQLRQMLAVVMEPGDTASAEGEAEPPRIRGDATVAPRASTRRDCPALPVAGLPAAHRVTLPVP